MDDTCREPSDDDPQGGYDVLCWRTQDGVGHRFDDDTYHGDNGNPSTWRAMCGTPIDNGVPDLDDPVDCMTCVVLEARRGAA